MSLSDKIKSAKSVQIQKFCKIGALLIGTELSDNDKESLKESLNTDPANPAHINNSALGRILRDEGYDISNSAVDRHRRGDCPCNRTGK